MQNVKIIFRQLFRQRLNSSLHIVGLTLGISVCLLIGLFLRYELSFDNYHKQADRIYRINSSWNNAGNINKWYSTPFPLADAIRKESTGVEHVTLVHPQRGTVVEIEPGKKFSEDNILIVDSEFPEIFDINVIRGDFKKTLSQPYQAALTESIAKKYFADQDPIGKTFTFKGEYSITVTSVIEDMPTNTHLQTSLFLSFAPNEKYLGQGLNNWTSVSGTSTYVVAPANADFTNLKAQLKLFCEKYIDTEPGLPKDFRSAFELQRLSTVHFDSSYGGSAAVKAMNTSWLWFFAFIGVAVLALACINFINLSTAQAISRAKEIGIRKSIGAGRISLLIHFLKEAFALCFIASIISIAAVQLTLPSLNILLEKGIQFVLFNSPFLVFSIIIGIVLVSFFAGIYPAWIITQFNPALALKSNITKGGGRNWIRKSLVVAQFTISIGLLIALVLMSQQVKLLLNKNLGFEKENILNVPIPERKGKTGFLSDELRKISAIKDFSFATATPSNWGHWMTQMSLNDKDDPNRKSVTMIIADEKYAHLYGLQLLNGRFSISSDTNYVSNDREPMKVVVNETLVKTLGFESNDEALGKRFWCGMGSGRAEIVGVMADFNTASLHEAIPPTFIMPFSGVYAQVGIKLEAQSDLPETISSIQKAWEKTYDGIFEFNFLDQQINDYYKSEMRLYTLFKFFAAVAMFISCMGLWGLATFAAQQRTKEIGIRKVLGASVQSIVSLLSKEFLIMTGLAIVIASPLAYYFMKNWLQTFAYHVDITVIVFVVTGLATTSIALLTVGFQSIRAALTNPVESLKSE